jgi:hypothetical protein
MANGGKRPGAGRKPGQMLPGHVALRDMCREHVAEAVARTLTIMRDEAHPKSYDAAQSILDRAWGKPTQATEISGPNGGAIPISSVALDVI